MEKGTKFGHYTIERKIGEGGMGEVYLAFDNSLERFVALKILSESFSKDAERVQRLKQEAKAASALNHPNIITIYEIGKTENIEFIAMEYVEGKTLREVIETTNLSLADAVSIAEQIADGLCIAHGERIAHRDIKPENIMLRNDGYVRILDFGLAKPAKLGVGSEEETLEMIRTAPGVVMGSVRYMSPEQARGKPVDERSDIWSLGVVLYEMIAGKAPFEGETVSDSLANLIHLEPKPITEILPDSPVELNNIVRKLLQKNRDERYQTAKEVTLDLKSLRRELELNYAEESSTRNYQVNSGSRHLSEETKTRIYQTDESKVKTDDDLAQTKILSQPVFAETQSRNSSYAIFGLIVLILLGGLAFASFKLFGGDKSDSNSFQNPQISVMSDDGKSRLPAISPDGRYIAFQSGELGARNIMVRQLATGSGVEIVPKSGLPVSAISFSPDTNYVYYLQKNAGKNMNTLYQVPTLGGTPKKIVDDVDSDITFSPDGKKFAFMRHSGTEGTDTLFTVNLDGTEEKAIIGTPQTEYGFFTNPAWSPISEKIVMTVGTNNGGETDSYSLAEVSLADRKLNLLANGKWSSVSDIHWKKDGTGVFALASEKRAEPDQVWSISYPNGERTRITNDTNSYNWLGVSGDDKTLITVKTDASSSIWSFSPVSKELKQLTPEGKNLSGDSGIAVMANGNLIVTRNKDSELNLWEITTDGKDIRQITSGSRLNADPKLSPDGTKICLMSNRSNVWRAWVMDADGNNAKQLTTVGEGVNQFDPNFVDGGKKIFYTQQEKNSGISKLMKVPIEGGIPERVFPASVENESGVNVSPDGKYMILSITDAAYNKTLQVFDLEGDKVSDAKAKFETGSMESIRWSPDGKSLTYIGSEGIPNILQISLDGKEKKQLTNFTAGRLFNFAWSRDGKQIFIIRGTVNNELILIKDEAK